MAEPKLQIEIRVERLEKALETIAFYLEGLDTHSSEKIQKILRGEDLEEANDNRDREAGTTS